MMWSRGWSALADPTGGFASFFYWSAIADPTGGFASFFYWSAIADPTGGFASCVGSALADRAVCRGPLISSSMMVDPREGAAGAELSSGVRAGIDLLFYACHRRTRADSRERLGSAVSEVSNRRSEDALAVRDARDRAFAGPSACNLDVASRRCRVSAPMGVDQKSVY